MELDQYLAIIAKNPALPLEGDMTPFMMACFYKKLDLVEKIYEFYTPAEKHLDVMALVKGKNKKTNKEEFYYDGEGRDTLQLAVEAGDLGVINFLCDEYNNVFDINHADVRGFTSVSRAIKDTKKDVLEKILDKQKGFNETYKIDCMHDNAPGNPLIVAVKNFKDFQDIDEKPSDELIIFETVLKNSAFIPAHIHDNDPDGAKSLTYHILGLKPACAFTLLRKIAEKLLGDDVFVIENVEKKPGNPQICSISGADETHKFLISVLIDFYFNFRKEANTLTILLAEDENVQQYFKNFLKIPQYFKGIVIDIHTVDSNVNFLASRVKREVDDNSYLKDSDPDWENNYIFKVLNDIKKANKADAELAYNGMDLTDFNAFNNIAFIYNFIQEKNGLGTLQYFAGKYAENMAAVSSGKEFDKHYYEFFILFEYVKAYCKDSSSDPKNLKDGKFVDLVQDFIEEWYNTCNKTYFYLDKVIFCKKDMKELEELKKDLEKINKSIKKTYEKLDAFNLLEQRDKVAQEVNTLKFELQQKENYWKLQANWGEKVTKEIKTLKNDILNTINNINNYSKQRQNLDDQLLEQQPLWNRLQQLQEQTLLDFNQVEPSLQPKQNELEFKKYLLDQKLLEIQNHPYLAKNEELRNATNQYNLLQNQQQYLQNQQQFDQWNNNMGLIVSWVNNLQQEWNQLGVAYNKAVDEGKQLQMQHDQLNIKYQELVLYRNQLVSDWNNAQNSMVQLNSEVLKLNKEKLDAQQKYEDFLKQYYVKQGELSNKEKELIIVQNNLDKAIEVVGKKRNELNPKEKTFLELLKKTKNLDAQSKNRLIKKIDTQEEEKKVISDEINELHESIKKVPVSTIIDTITIKKVKENQDTVKLYMENLAKINSRK